jgi:OMF family outer membrane factor
MFFLRYCVCVSVGILAALPFETSLMAQTLSSVEGESEAAKLLLEPEKPLKTEPRVSDIKQMGESSVKSQTEKHL